MPKVAVNLALKVSSGALAKSIAGSTKMRRLLPIWYSSFAFRLVTTPDRLYSKVTVWVLGVGKLALIDLVFMVQ